MQFRKVVARLASPQVLDFLTRMSQAYNPIPRSYRNRFYRSEFDALAADLARLNLDWWRARKRLIENSTQTRRLSRNATRRAKEEEREPPE
jgi:hypothetical protein